ncbi:MAG: PGF-pre-PGF domain-containing protein [Nanoarchaeota archaeon]
MIDLEVSRNGVRKQIIFVMLLLLIPLASALVFPKETLFFDRLVANNEQIKLINNEDILFTSVGITVNKDVTRARITVQAMPDCPENAPYQENVLQCFYISGFEFKNEQVAHTKISFKVPKEWIEANNYDKIELRRYSYSWNANVHGKFSSWKPLITNFEKETNDYNQYTAFSDGINYFSIVGIEKEIIIPTLKEVNMLKISSNAVRIIPKKEVTGENTNVESKNFSWLPSLFLSLTMLLVIFTPKFEKETPFEQLTNYIKNSNHTEHRLKYVLKSNGWEDWQIKLAFEEVKK